MIFDQRLSHVRHTLRYNESTLSLRPRAAATKNKMRMAENAFIFLIGNKNNPGEALYYRFFRARLWNQTVSHSAPTFIFISYMRGRREWLGGCRNNHASLLTVT